jgi:hypothetical protein
LTAIKAAPARAMLSVLQEALMIFLLEGFSDDIVALAARGHVTREDYKDVLLPRIEAALKAHPKVRLYYEIGPDFGGFAPGALWEDFVVGMEHLTRWERVAVITDVAWINLATAAFTFMMPGRVRTFETRDAPQAKAWIESR